MLALTLDGLGYTNLWNQQELTPINADELISNDQAPLSSCSHGIKVIKEVDFYQLRDS
jgi:hypothetical protein